MNKTKITVCDQCGKTIEANTKYYQIRKKRFCSRECAGLGPIPENDESAFEDFENPFENLPDLSGEFPEIGLELDTLKHEDVLPNDNV